MKKRRKEGCKTKDEDYSLPNKENVRKKTTRTPRQEEEEGKIRPRQMD